jgi:hypothetical protein
MTTRGKPNLGDRGSALIIALVMIVMVGLLASVTLSYGATSLHAQGNAIAPDRQATYAADGAVDLAVKYLDTHTAVGVDGGGTCGDPSSYGSVLTLPASGTAPSVTVQCQPVSGSGAVTGASGPGAGGVTATTPSNAILTLGSGNGEPGPYNTNALDSIGGDPGYAERGVHVRRSTSGGATPIVVGGSITSNSPVRASTSAAGAPPSLSVTAGNTISARGGCEYVSGCTTVPYTTAPTADPGYPSRTPVLTARTVPVCPTGTLVKFLPGWYKSAAALNDLFATCKNKDFWFSPGTYYFDFRDTGAGTQCRATSAPAATATHEWCIGSFIDDRSVVLGGTPAGGWVETPPGSTTTFSAATSASAAPAGVWTNVTAAQQIDGTSAALTWGAAGAATVTASGWPSLPASAETVTAVTVDVKSTVTAGATRYLDVVAGDGTDCGAKAVNGNSVTISGLASCLSTPSKVNGMTVTVGVNATSASGSATVDGTAVHVTYAPSPAWFTFPDGCDDSQPGVQFIFGGDSRVYVSDGSFELCAGPNPRGTTTNQRIAIYGVRPTPPLATNAAAAVAGQSWATVTNANNALAIGEQPTATNATITFTPKCGTSAGQITCRSGAGSGVAYASIKVTFPAGQFALPAQTKLQRVDLRASYNTNINLAPQYQVSGTGFTCTADANLPAVPATSAYARSLTGCLNAARLAAGFSVEWRARVNATCVANVCNANAPVTQTLDGLQVLVALAASSASTAVVLPETGCIVSYPDDYGAGSAFGRNYWDGLGSDDCALLRWDAIPSASGGPSRTGCYSGEVEIDGTVYAPGAAVDLEQAGPPAPGCDPVAPTYGSWSYPIFGRGLIARHLRIRGMRGTSLASPTPPFGCGVASGCGGNQQDRQVTLQAVINGTTKVQATVNLPADSGAPKILSWTVS